MSYDRVGSHELAKEVKIGGLAAKIDWDPLTEIHDNTHMAYLIKLNITSVYPFIKYTTQLDWFKEKTLYLLYGDSLFKKRKEKKRRLFIYCIVEIISSQRRKQSAVH